MNTERLSAVVQIVATPDGFDCWRQHRLTQPGKPERFDMHRDQPIRYVNVTRFERWERSLA